MSLELLLRLRLALSTATVMAGLLLIDGQFGPLSFSLRRLLASVALGVITLTTARGSWKSLSTVGMCATIALISTAPSVPFALLAYTLAVAIIEVRAVERWSFVSGLSQVCLLYVGLQFISDLIPQSAIIKEAVCSGVNQYIKAAAGTDSIVGSTAAGCDTVKMLALFLIWRWWLFGSPLRVIAACTSIVTWFAILPFILPAPSAGALAVFVRTSLYGLAWIVLAAIIDTFAQSPPSKGASFALSRPHVFAAIGFLGCFVAGLTLVAPVNPFSTPNRSIVVHNRGGLDWERPVFGKFGAFSGGMFGLWPVYSRAEGYRFEIIDHDKITLADLDGFQTLVLINSPKHWIEEDLIIIRTFVANGGSLLVLGDHTDVFGLMRGFNSLLTDFGIQFQFDSAYHARIGWRGCLAPAPDAVACGWDNENPGIAIGASLAISRGARPLLCGRFGHSDDGVRSNVVGSFLGNYKLEEGERIGDLVLIAESVYGKGRVIVFGDTSPFQGGLTHMHPRIVGPLLNLLARPTCIFERSYFRLFATTFLAIVLVILCVVRGDVAMTSLIALALYVGIGSGWLVTRSTLDSPLTIAPDCFVIDGYHLPAVGHYEAHVNPIGPLYTTLHRCGLRIAYLEKWDRAQLLKARGIALIAPTRSFTNSELEDLLQFEELGGIVLLVAGYPDALPPTPLLLAHDLSIEARPLGTIPNGSGRGQKEKELPRFIDPWPIISTSGRNLRDRSDVDVLYRTDNDTVSLYCRRGRGGLILVSDRRFFSSMNIEDTWGHWIGNLALMHDIFCKYLRVDPDTVAPLFPSPVKPN